MGKTEAISFNCELDAWSGKFPVWQIGRYCIASSGPGRGTNMMNYFRFSVGSEDSSVEYYKHSALRINAAHWLEY